MVLSPCLIHMPWVISAAVQAAAPIAIATWDRHPACLPGPPAARAGSAGAWGALWGNKLPNLRWKMGAIVTVTIYG